MKKLAIPLAAIIAITALELFALSQGVNGLALAGSVAIIAGLTGYIAPHRKSQ